MAKAVLISIRPEWVEKIANGWKTIEVRKTKPYLDTPFKCYIYCTNKRPFLVWGDVFRGDWVTEVTRLSGYVRHYAFGREAMYGWHISDLKIYDQPKQLSEFKGLRKTKFGYAPVEIKRPPQSWCYVEEQ